MNQLVRTSLLLCSLLMGLVALVPAQSVDVTKVLADPKTYTFSDNKHTVKTYIYEALEAQTTCCGPARMYLEVKIDPTGYVLNVKPLTGLDQECYAKSVQDIVKNIKWNAKGFSAAKSIYFEIKPSIECGEGRDNAYAQVKIFNNEKVDANGVPLNYASSTGVSASAAAGTSGTPEVEAGEAEEAAPGEMVAASEEGSNKPAEGGLPTPPAKPGEKPSTATGVPDVSSSANNEMKSALEMAQADRERQEEEIKRLKDELAAAKAAEEEKKRREEEEADRLAQEEAERQRMAEEQRRKEEAAERRRQEEEERRAMAEARRKEKERGESRSGGGFRDVDYGENKYADNDQPEQDPPRSMTDVERKQAEADRARRELDDLKARMRDMENAQRRSQSDLARMQTDIIRAEERRLRAEAEVAAAREREEKERLENERRRVMEEQREKERMVQDKMREMERMKADLERAVADLERLEADLQQKEQEKLQKEQEIEVSRAQREAEIEAQLDQLRLASGGAQPGETAPGIEQPFNGDSGEVSKQLEILRQQILILTQQINDLRNGGGGFVGTPVSRAGTPRGGDSGSRSRVASNGGKFKSAADNRSWEKFKSIDDILDPNRKEEYAASTFNVVSEPAPNQGGTRGADGGVAEHANLPGPKVTKPVYAGGSGAMKQFVADELKKASVCGLAQSAFEVTIDGSGKVIAHNILAVNNQNLLLYLPAILQQLQFQPTGSGLPVRAVYEIKAEITCEGVEKVDLNSVPNMIRN